jgi:hypothetical protein
MREEMLAGTFSPNKHPVIILFDSRASHDFTSSTCAKKAMLSRVTAEALYVISTPGGWVDADRIVCKAPLELAGRVFSTDLIILKGEGLDAILWMSWMKLHRAVLDIAGRLVHLVSRVYGKVILHLPTISRIKASLHHVVELKLQDIHVVREFPDVFPNDLPRMPPEWAIKFKIELQPGTVPIAKARTRCHMWRCCCRFNCRVCWTKCISTQVHHLGVVQRCLWRRRTKSYVYVWIIDRSMQSPSRTSIHSHALTSCLIN